MSAEHTEHSEEVPHVHDQAAEIAHAWHHFHENVRFFACFLGVILLTVFAFNINFGSWNTFAVLVLAAMRSGLIAYFMASMFKPFSFVTSTFIFSAIFLAGMIFLSLWDSTIKPGWIGDPIRLPGQYDVAPAPTPEKTTSHVP
jgi:hypothetical protein